MHPILLQIHNITLHSYGALIVVGFFIGVWLIRQKAKKEKLNPETITDIAFWALVNGLIGGRVLFVITRWNVEFAENPMKIFRFWEGGLVYYGGFIAGVGTFLYLSRKYKLPTIAITDMAAPSLAIAQFFGRLGCFAAGCCFGQPIDPSHSFAVIFSDPNSAAPLGAPIHPTQLYDAANTLIIFTILELVYRKRKFRGQPTAIYLMVYAVGRAIVESYRGDSIRGFVIEGWLSTSQFLSIFIFAAGVLVWRIYSKKTA